jgi:SAM-dependent methyltransferase
MKIAPATGNQTSSNTEYVFDNTGERAETRFRDLSALYDERTIHYLEERGIEEGWSCLEVGGGGSITSWLCARVGVRGRVLATDIKPRFLHSLSFPNLEVWRPDIRKEPPPRGEFDLVHARLVLIHLPERESALKIMVAALKPGGWLVIDEFDELSFLPDPAVNPGEVNLRARHAFQQVRPSAGIDMRHGRLLTQNLQSNGLLNRGEEASMFVWKARSAGTRLFKLGCEELREAITGWCYMSPSEFEADMKRVDEQDFFTLSQRLWTAWGQLPYAEMDGTRSHVKQSVSMTRRTK